MQILLSKKAIFTDTQKIVAHFQVYKRIISRPLFILEKTHTRVDNELYIFDNNASKTIIFIFIMIIILLYQKTEILIYIP